MKIFKHTGNNEAGKVFRVRTPPMTQTSEAAAPITQAEMIEMFGDTMPIEAAMLLDEANDETTVGELRAKLRKIAADKRAAEELCPLSNRFAVLFEKLAAWSDGGFSKYEVEKLRKCASALSDDLMQLEAEKAALAEEVERLREALKNAKKRAREQGRLTANLIRQAHGG